MKAAVRNVPVACSIVVSAFCPVSAFRSIHLINTHRINIATLGHFAFDLTYSKQRVSIALAMPRTRSESVSVSCLAQERVLMPHCFFFLPLLSFELRKLRPVETIVYSYSVLYCEYALLSVLFCLH